MTPPSGYEELTMHRDHDLAAALHRGVEDVTTPPRFLENVRAGGQRRLARRRERAAALTVVTACAIVGGVLIADPGWINERASVSDRGAPAVTPTATATMPNLIGLDHDAAWTRYAALGLDHADIRYVASNDVPLGTVVAQDPPAGDPAPRTGMLVTLTYSAGGPAVPLDDVPSQAADLLRDSLLPDEQVLVVSTDAGIAYKIDAVLVGPCPAVVLAYRTFPDPSYGDRCY
jgi:hypothetical protein